MSGYIYFATNPAMPGLTKIGFTECVLADRFSDLQSTGVPAPFELFAAFHVNDPRTCEQTVHGALIEERVSENREFFRIEAKDAIATVLPLILSSMSAGLKKEPDPVGLFGDLNDSERDMLAAYAMAPSHQRPHEWTWFKRMFGLSELDARHFLHTLKTKGYLREVRGYSGPTPYDLTPRGVQFGLMAREDETFQQIYGDEGVFYRDWSRHAR